MQGRWAVKGNEAVNQAADESAPFATLPVVVVPFRGPTLLRRHNRSLDKKGRERQLRVLLLNKR